MSDSPQPINLNPDTPTEIAYRARRARRRWCIAALLVLIALYLAWWFLPSVPEEHLEIKSHFAYGSIGSDNPERGLPYWIWKVLPRMFPDYLPNPNEPGYTSFGFLHEPLADRPIGFSKRRVRGVDFVGINCAACHVSDYRESKGALPRIVLGMPAQGLDLQGFFRFLFKCASDGRFTVSAVMAEIDRETQLGTIERLMYKNLIVPGFREGVLSQKQKVAYWDKLPPNGPGRIDTFGPYAALFFNLPPSDSAGAADFPALWNQRPREGMNLHWDGNNDSVFERNYSASFGAGATPTTIDEPRLARVANWVLDAGPPPFPADKLDQKLADRGKPVYAQHCASCHDWKGEYVGKVDPIDKIGTDRNRLDSFSETLQKSMNTIGEGYPWRFTHFKKTNGYANTPLDGLWLKAPYLHNGSVPTLTDLLKPPAQRPKTFHRGYDVYDWENAGFLTNVAEENGRRYPLFDTAAQGNGNGGHAYGTQLPDEDKRALIEYLKTL